MSFEFKMAYQLAGTCLEGMALHGLKQSLKTHRETNLNRQRERNASMSPSAL